VTIKAAIAALQRKGPGNRSRCPRRTSSTANIKEGSILSRPLDNFFVGNSFPACKIGFSAEEIMGKSEAKSVV